MLTIGFIGAGNMAKAMMQGWSGNADIRQVVYSPNSGAQVAAELGLEAKQSALGRIRYGRVGYATCAA